jgi:hypothetical protein
MGPLYLLQRRLQWSLSKTIKNDLRGNIIEVWLIKDQSSRMLQEELTNIDQLKNRNVFVQIVTKNELITPRGEKR